jgi:ACS family tartrate transporter-like MFS transporter
MSVDPALAGVLPAAVRRKVAWRVVPLIFVLYVIAYLDRANLAFAKLGMQGDLDWLDNSVYGWGSGFFFFAGYLLLEIPGALIVEHWSARKWFCRILLTWGVCSMAMAFVQTPWQFYLARFLLGLAEAGFFPGVIVYLTHWFPRADRARALSGLVFGVPFSLALGTQLSEFIMRHGWFDLSGWQWVFLIEGAPAVLFGALIPFIMTDRPGQARWLSQAEREWLGQTLQRERAEAAAAGSVTLGQALRQSSLWILSLGILATNTGGYAMGFWMPTFIDNMLKAPLAPLLAVSTAGMIASPGGDGSFLAASALAGNATAPTGALNYLGLVYLCGLAGVLISGQSSDRAGERKWHCIAGQVGTGVFLALGSLIPGQPFGLIMIWLCLMGFCAYFWPPPFWVLPTMSMSASAAAVSIGVINICANVAGLIGSTTVGQMKASGWSDAMCMLFGSSCYVGGGVIIAMLRVKPKPSSSER